MRLTWIFLATVLFLTTCSWEETLVFQDFQSFQSYHRGDRFPFVHTQESHGVRFYLRYLPADALLADELRRATREREKILIRKEGAAGVGQRCTAAEWEALRKRQETYRESVYFRLTIGFEDEDRDLVFHRMKSSMGDYHHWLHSLQFGLKSKVFLENAQGERVALAAYHFERSFGLRKSRDFLLVFPADLAFKAFKDRASFTLVIREFGLKTGLVRLRPSWRIPKIRVELPPLTPTLQS